MFLRNNGVAAIVIKVTLFIVDKGRDSYYKILHPLIQYICYKLKYGSTAPNPWEIIFVRPDEIEYLLTPRFRELSKTGTHVVDGEWDQSVCQYELMLTSLHSNYNQNKRCKLPFDNYGLYRASELHFKNDVGWEETDFYKWMDDLPERVISGYRSSRFSQFDKLYENISSNGYLSQKELTQDSKLRFLNRNAPDDEVLINIGRDGELIMDDGRHRLIIAKILGVEEIPVRVHVRHKKWIEMKSDLSDKKPESIQNHPDVKQ